MFKEVLGKINESIPEDLKEQAREKIKEQASSSMEAAKARFFGGSDGSASGAVEEAAVPSEGATSGEAQATPASEVETSESVEGNAEVETADADAASTSSDSEQEDAA